VKKITRRIAIVLAAPVLAAGLALATASGASAAPAAACSGAGCTLSGSMSVTQTITITATPLSFSVPATVAGTTSFTPGGSGANQEQWTVTALTGDVNGYGVYAISTSDWVDNSNSNVSFPATDSIIDQPNSNLCWGQSGGDGCGSGEIPNVTLPESTDSPVLTDSAAGASNPAGDSYEMALVVSVPASARQASYTLGLAITAIAN
jgi:hypothetical protein